MKKVIAVLLSVVLTVGSIGITPVLAAETNSQGTVVAQKESVAEEDQNSEKEVYENETAPGQKDLFGDQESALVNEWEPENVIGKGKNEDKQNEEGASAIATDAAASGPQTTDAATAEPQTSDTTVGEIQTTDQVSDVAGTEPQTTNPEETAVETDTSNDANELGEFSVIEEEAEAASVDKIASAEEVVDSGSSGDANWTLTGKYSNLTLTISGSGAIGNYDLNYYDDYYIEFFGPQIPWFDYRSSIRRIVVEEGITVIGTYAFSYCQNLVSVTLPDSLKHIRNYAFYNSSLESITIPSSLTSLGFKAVYAKKIHINSLESWLNIEISPEQICNLYLNDEPLTDVIIPDSITKINDNAFVNCATLTSVKIPNSVESIGNGAFSGCSSLSSISIPNSVQSIGENAFNQCTALTRVTIPSSVTDMGGYAFYKCNKISSLTLNDGLKSIGDRAFAHCTRLKSVTIPSSVTSIGGYAFYNCGLTSIVFPPNVSSVGGNAFAANEITSIKISEGTTRICNNAFSGCGSVESIIVPEGVTSIGGNAFYECVSLKSISLPSSLVSMEGGAFSRCSNLEKIQITDLDTWLNIEHSSKFTFQNGYSLYVNNKPVTDLVIPDGYTNIGQYVFSGCRSLKSVKIANSVKDIGSYAFAECSNLESITIPSGVTTMGYFVFSECGSLKNIWIPDSVTSIEKYSFYKCSGLKSISIPSSVMYIGEYAFGEPDDYFDYDLIPGNVIDATIIFRGTEEQWNALSKRNVYYKYVIFSTFSANATFELSKTVFNYTGKPVKPSVTVDCSGKQLIEGKDYKLEYQNNVNLGTAAVIVKGIGDYSGSVKLEFRIRLGNTPKITCTNVASGMKVSWEKVSGATRYDVYRGSKFLFTTSSLAVTDKEVKYNGGKKYTYKVIAFAKGYGKSDLFKTGTYYRLMPVGIKSLTNPSAGKMTVTYDKSSGSSGYVVRYGLKSDMSDAKVITVQGQNTLSRTFGSMKKGKTYYVQVRTYKIENGVRYYSGFCTTKTITIKK